MQVSNWRCPSRHGLNNLDFLTTPLSRLTLGERDNKQRKKPPSIGFICQMVSEEARGMVSEFTGDIFSHVVNDRAANCQSSLLSERLGLNVGSISSGMDSGLAGSSLASAAVNVEVPLSDSGIYSFLPWGLTAHL